jgi:hypothetical protein
MSHDTTTETDTDESPTTTITLRLETDDAPVVAHWLRTLEIRAAAAEYATVEPGDDPLDALGGAK